MLHILIFSVKIQIKEDLGSDLSTLSSALVFLLLGHFELAQNKFNTCLCEAFVNTNTNVLSEKTSPAVLNKQSSNRDARRGRWGKP